jgi:hypothetical protein
MTRIGHNARPIVEAALRRAEARIERTTRRRRETALAYRRTQHPEEDVHALPAADWSAARLAARERFRRAHIQDVRARDYAASLTVDLEDIG